MSVVLFFKGHDSLLPFTVKNIINAPNQIVEMGQMSKHRKINSQLCSRTAEEISFD